MTIQIGSIAIPEEDIMDISMRLKIDEISATLPIDEMTLEARCSEDTANAIKYNAKMVIYDNAEQIGIFFVREFKKVGSRSYLINGVSQVGILAERSFPGKFFQTSSGGYYLFSEAVAEILGDDIDYLIEDEVADFDVRGFIGHCSRREAIRHLCFCAGATVYNNKGVLTFRRTLGSAFSGNMNNEHSYQQSEVFNDYTVKDGALYSKYSIDVYTFTKVSTTPDSNEYVTDPSTGEMYIYSIEKVTRTNSEYPDNRPSNELYIQGEMLVTSFSFAEQVLANISKYYAGGKYLEFRVIDSEPRNYGVGFFDGERMIFGYPSEINVSYGKNQVYGRLNSIEYTCSMAYEENARKINVNYKNEAGDLLYTQTFIKGSEESFVVKHPIITLIVDNRHKIIYKSPEMQSVYTDDVYAEPVDIDVICEVAVIQNGNSVEIYQVDEALQFNDVLYIGGTVDG